MIFPPTSTTFASIFQIDHQPMKDDPFNHHQIFARLSDASSPPPLSFQTLLLMMRIHIVWKLFKNVASHFSYLGIFHQFLSGNTVWPLAKIDHFLHFWLTFVHSKYRRSSLRSQCWMRVFLWFSNIVNMLESKINPLGKSRKEGLKLKEGSLA